MNGYLRALQRIVPSDVSYPLPSPSSRQDVSLQKWIRSMNCISQMHHAANAPRSSAAEVERVAAAPRADEHTVTPIDRMSEHVRLLDPAVSFVLNVLFDSNRTKVEVRIARAMFRPGANIVLIPRERPTLACAVGVDEFFATEKEMLRCSDGWEEALRLHDPVTDAAARMRVRAHILLDPRLSPAKARGVDVIFTLRNASTAQRIHSCTIVYDEAPRARSPVTLFG